jgi:hypothetical protein
MKLHIAVGIVCAILAGVGVSYPAAADSVPAATWSGCLSTTAPCSTPNFPGTTTVTGTNSTGTSTATVTVTQSPVAGITATTTSNSPNSSGAGATADGTLTYFLEVTYSGPLSPTTFNLGYIANGSVTGSPLGAEAFVTMTVAPASGPGGSTSVALVNGMVTTPSSDGLQPGFNPASFTISNTLQNVPLDELIEVQLSVQADSSATAAGVTSTTATAFIDPMFFVDLADPTGFSITLSDGIGNATATPLPAALPLFATGLGALALLGWRRKRVARSIAA